MRKTFYVTFLSILCLTGLCVNTSQAQDKTKKKQISKREAERRRIHSQDSLMRSINKSDTSISSLLQRIETYETAFNQINNSLADGLDTALISQQLPQVIKAIDRIGNAANTHKASTLRFLFVLRDNLDHLQDKLDGWQNDLQTVNTKLAQNQSDLLKFTKDSLLKTIPADSEVRVTFFRQKNIVKVLWKKVDSINRSNLLKVNLLQDKTAISYTKILDESDQIDSKIKGFAMKAIDGESGYLWEKNPQNNKFSDALNGTVRLNKLLFGYFLKTETETHLAGIIFFILIFSWIIYNRSKIFRNNENVEAICLEAKYICKRPIVSSLLVIVAITPYFYDQPPVVFLQTFFLGSMILSLVLLRKDVAKSLFSFLIILFVLAIAYGVSNLLIAISNADRYLILLLSVFSIVLAYVYRKKLQTVTEGNLPYADVALKAFMWMQAFSLLLNVSGRFSLAKIVGVTAVFNLWLLVILYLVVHIIIQGLFLQFQIKKGGNSFINWIDYNLVQKKFKNMLIVASALVWLFFLLQNLNIDDWAKGYASDILDEPRSIGGATFTYGGFVIFIVVIWLSSVASKVISYLYDVSAQRVTDLSVFKKKNRTSALIIRIGVFSVGFLLAVAASGFPLDKLTIIISAFGVGIGFGLQNIVNNLVSGLILAFEKPINIGDVVEIDGHTGTMKEIGIRSSKVVTGDGSEVIIPNGDLISHQVVNWTLSNSNRQVELKVLTAYGVEIDKVKDVLKNLLLNRQDIMNTPAPAVFVNNVSEAAVEFKVLFWVADINTTGELKSKILTAIYEAIGKQGIKMPSTQKDFYIHFPDGVPLSNPVAVPEKKTEPVIETPKENPEKKDQ